MSVKKTRRVFLKSTAASGLAVCNLNINDSDAQIHSSCLSSSFDKYINTRKVLLYECTRKEIRERLASGKLKAAIIPTGATEQHNEHMAMIMDTAGALLVSQYAALKLYPQVIVTTPVSIGYSPYWMERQGTLTLRKETLQAVVYDICCSIKTHGIKTILILNGHGGNAKPLSDKVSDFRLKLGINIEFCSYWDFISPDFAKSFMESGIVPGHASEFETSFALVAFPERIHEVSYEGVDPYKWNVDKTDLDRVGFYKAVFDKPEFDKTSFEESKLATAEKGERAIALAVEGVVEKLRKMIG